MRIVFCYITPFHPNKGGIGRVTDALTRELQRRGHDIFYLIYPSGITIRHEFDYPAPLEYLPSKDLLSQDNIDSYIRFLKDNKIDIVVNQSGNFDDSRLWLKCRTLGIPVVSVLHTYPSNSNKYIWKLKIEPLRDTSFKEHLKRIARIILYPQIKKRSLESTIKEFRQMVPKSDLVCALSEKFYPQLEPLCPGFKSKYRFIPNPNSYTEIEVRPKKKQIVWVALFGNIKREDWMAKIWRKIASDYPDWKLVIIGYGPTGRINRLNKLLKGIDNVTLTGYTDPKPYQEESSIACMTSISEAWGMVLTESMQCGCVPIAYNSFPSASEIIENGTNGILIEPFNESQYIKKLRYLIENNEYRERLSKNARESVKKYDIEKVTDKWEMLFNELIQQNGNAQH